MPDKFSSRQTRQWGTRFDSLPLSSSPPSPTKSEASSVQEHVVARNHDQVDASPSTKKVDKMPHDASVFVGSLPPNMDNDDLSRLLADHLAEHAEVKSIKVVRDRQGGVCAFVQCQDAASAARLIHTLRSKPPKPFLGRNLRYEPARAFRTLLISYRTPTEDIPMEQNNTDGNLPLPERRELTLPFAMRIWKAKNHKQLSITYNQTAIEAERQRGPNYDLATEPVLHLEDLAFDEMTLRTICAHFGALDTFEALRAGDDDPSTRYASYPLPHNAPRKPQMDGRCFEAKWEHRDDCVTALMTLRHVPHLTVTWAHTASPDIAMHKRRFTQPGSPQHHRLPPNRGRMASQPTTSLSPMLGSGLETEDGRWATPAIGMHESPCTSQNSTLVDNTPVVDGHSLSWTEIDFPPLHQEAKTINLHDDPGLWNQNRIPFNKELIQCHNPIGNLTTMFGELEVSKTDLTPRPDIAHPHEGSEMEVPQLVMSPTTPKSPASLSLLTPSNDGDNDAGERVFLDPTTLFVGGLEMYGPSAWDEAKVRNYFQKFDGLEDVRVIRPANGKAAFAFVKFNNAESPAQAINQEHNRIYEGRAMRVQLRECNPTRGTNWRNRGRGRFHYGQPNRPHIEPLQIQAERPLDPDRTLTDMSISTDATDDVLKADRKAELIPQMTEKPVQAQDSVSTASLSSTVEAPAQTERYREWYEIEVPPPNVSPSPATPLSAPESSTGTPYAAPPASGYFAPQWVPAYPPQMQYPVPYVPGYPVYHPIPNPPAPAPFSGSNASDGSSSAPVTPGHWQPVGMYGAYVPYPYPPRPPQLNTEQSSQSQPPVAPTGFYHNDHTLFAVYRPEAIDQYNQVHGNQTPSQPVSAPVPRVWPQYPPPPPAYPVPNSAPSPARVTPMPPTYMHAPKPLVNMGGWIQPQPSAATRPQGPPSVGAPNSYNGGSFRGHQPEGGGYAKRGRRDGGYHHHGNRNGHNRQGPHRNGRAASHGNGAGVMRMHANEGDVIQLPHHGEFSANAAQSVGDYDQGWPAVPGHGRREPNKAYLS
ncbi:hypothetical protein VNI00_001839 [Paramarasmius palmivorus]|uniref:RRM domain-containing protein n=1 Tax=Paramarasmius palmivorus TaxID=297713 RepID=A0AAW0E502_9AGAR